MSVFGGDSWAREAQHRKRRVDDLLTEGIDTSTYKKLSNGKFACLICPHHPVLDTPLMLSTHAKGSRHQAAATQLKERGDVRASNMNKRKALSDDSAIKSSISYRIERRPAAQPLTKQTRTTSEIRDGKASEDNVSKGKQDLRSGVGQSVRFSSTSDKGHYPVDSEVAYKEAPQMQIDYSRLEKELKFTAAGWKRDCHGKWFKDENVSIGLRLSLILTRKIQIFVLHHRKQQKNLPVSSTLLYATHAHALKT